MKNIHERSKTVKLKHADEMISLGREIHKRLIQSLFIAPLILLAHQLFIGKSQEIQNYLVVLADSKYSLSILFAIIFFGFFVGVMFKEFGYRLIEEAGKN